MASVGSIELENIKQQATGIQSELSSMKPKIQEEFRQLKDEFRCVSTSMELIKAQLGLLTRMCSDMHDARVNDQSLSDRSSVTEDMVMRSTPLSASSDMGILVSKTPDQLSASKDSDTEMLI